MLTNTIEYKALKERVAKFLNMSSEGIHSIVKPMRNKKLPYILVTLIDARFRSVLLRDTKGGFTVVK